MTGRFKVDRLCMLALGPAATAQPPPGHLGGVRTRLPPPPRSGIRELGTRLANDGQPGGPFRPYYARSDSVGNKSKKTLEREAAKANKQKSMSKKQIRARARRGAKLQEDEIALLYKPLEEWDDEELARGRPRAKDGSFKGATPSYISRRLHEEIMRRFQEIVKGGMNAHTVKALEVLGQILENDDLDEKGRPMIPAGVKLDCSKFLIEHVVGKPTQRQEVDISVRLQAILATATVTVDDEGTGLVPGLPAGGIFDTQAREEEDDEDD